MQRSHTSAEIDQMRAIAAAIDGDMAEDWVRACIVAEMSVAEMEECAEVFRLSAVLGPVRALAIALSE